MHPVNHVIDAPVVLCESQLISIGFTTTVEDFYSGVDILDEIKRRLYFDIEEEC